MVAEPWAFFDDIAVLAWLDFSIQRCLKFDDTITGHLRKIRGKDLTIADIESRLHRLWQIDQEVHPDRNLKHSHTGFNPKELREKGSSYYLNLPRDARRSIETALRRYNISKTQMQTSSSLEGQRELGDEEENHRLVAEAGQGYKLGADQLIPISPTEQEMAKENGMARMRTPKRSRDDNNANAIEPNAKRASKISADCRERPIQTRSNIHNLAPKGVGTRSQNRAGHNNADRVKKSSQNHRDMNQSLETMKLKHQEELAAKDLEIERMRDEWQVEVENLREQETKWIQKQEELQAENRHLIIAKHQRELNGRESLETNLSEKNQEIWRLTHELYMLKRTKNIEKADECMSIQTKIVDDAMDHIGLDLESIIHGQSLGEQLHITKLSLLTSIESLGPLALCALGIDINDAKGKLELQTYCSKFEAQTIIRAFILAAVRNWVFMTDFPAFVSNKPSLLPSYRKVVMNTDGWTGLRKLELEAYRISTNTPKFENLNITKRATQLAIRLSKALAPLFPLSFDDSMSNEDNEFETWGEDPVVWNNRKFRFKSIFKTALKLKIATVMADQEFEFVIYSPSKSYLLTDDDGNPYAESNSPSQNGKVGGEKWMHASFHVYKRNAMGSKTCIDDALVRSKNFVVKSKQDRLNSASHSHTKHILIPKRRAVGNGSIQRAPPSQSTIPMSPPQPQPEGERRRIVAKEPTKNATIATSQNRKPSKWPVYQPPPNFSCSTRNSV